MYLKREVRPQIYRSQTHLWPETPIFEYIHLFPLSQPRLWALILPLFMVPSTVCLHESDLIEFAWFTDALTEIPSRSWRDSTSLCYWTFRVLSRWRSLSNNEDWLDRANSNLHVVDLGPIGRRRFDALR